MTRLRLFVAALLITAWAATAVGKPPTEHINKLYEAENVAEKHYNEKAYDKALDAAEDMLDKHDGAAAKALAGPRKKLEDRVDSWDLAAIRLRYFRAISLRELGRLREASAAFATLAEQKLDPDVQKAARGAYARLQENTVPVRFFCAQGGTFRFYPRDSRNRGPTQECNGLSQSNLFNTYPGRYTVLWQGVGEPVGRHLDVELGPAVYVHLFDPPPAEPGGGGCASAPGVR